MSAQPTEFNPDELLAIAPSEGWKRNAPEEMESTLDEEALQSRLRHLKGEFARKWNKYSLPGESPQQFLDRVRNGVSSVEHDCYRMVWMMHHVQHVLGVYQRERTEAQERQEQQKRRELEKQFERAKDAPELMKVIRDAQDSERFLTELYIHLQKAVKARRARGSIASIQKASQVAAEALDRKSPSVPSPDPMSTEAERVLTMLVTERFYTAFMKEST